MDITAREERRKIRKYYDGNRNSVTRRCSWKEMEQRRENSRARCKGTSRGYGRAGLKSKGRH